METKDYRIIGSKANDNENTLLIRDITRGNLVLKGWKINKI